jgi:hypothetical protein
MLPVVCAVLGVVWVLWLARGSRPAGDGSSEQPPSSQATPRREARPQSQEAATSRAESRGPGAATSAAPSADEARSSIDPEPQLAFETPGSASIGEAFDVRLVVTARQPIGRIVVEIDFDPALLKVRSTEEVDYSRRRPGERGFSIDPSGSLDPSIDGHVRVVMAAEPGTTGRALPNSAPVIQLEALAQGSTQVRIASVSVSDTADRPLQWSATGRESPIILN